MSEQEAFDALVHEFYPVWFRYHPDIALTLGIPGFENRLPAVDDDELGALGVWLENLVVGLGEISFSQLDPDRQMDYRLLLEAAQVEYWELLVRDWRHLDPTRFLPVQEIFQLTLHPPEELRTVLLNLLRALPDYLRQARAQITERPELIAPEMINVALAEAQTGIKYLQALSGSVWLQRQCRGSSEIQDACDESVAAMGHYLDSLRDQVAPAARGRLGCGEANFIRLLQRRHFIDIPISGLRRYLEALYQDTFRLFEQHAAAMGITGEPGFALAHLARQASYVGEERLQVYRDEAKQLSWFIRRTGILSLPGQPFRITQRPLCPLPNACDSGYVQDSDRRSGVFFISGQGSEEARLGEPRSVIRSHCIRQGWLGAHLLNFGGESHARDLPRRLAPTGVFATAWDLYIRQVLAGMDYFDDEDRLVHLVHQLHALKLALVDMDLNLGRIDAREAAAALARYEPDVGIAAGLLARLARHPTDALAGAVGWLLLFQAHALQQETDAAFNLEDFHNRVLNHGQVPPALMIPYSFGDELWARVQAELTL